MENLNLEKFQGPLDLLLQLIEGEKLDITEISLAKVTEQFFHHLNSLEEERSEELADFLVIATKLVYIKSRQLLPYLYPPEDEGQNLADQLKFYKRYADASKWVGKLWSEQKMGYGRVEPPKKSEGFILPLNSGVSDLYSAIKVLLKRLTPINPLPSVKIDKTVSVQEKIKSIFEVLQKIKKLSFKNILNDSQSKTEVIVSFLALLELVKQEKVSIHQQNSFEDLLINKI